MSKISTQDRDGDGKFGSQCHQPPSSGMDICMDGIFRSEKDLQTNQCLQEKYTLGGKQMIVFFP